MIRMALGFAVRQGLATAVHRWWRHVPSLGLAPLLLRQRPRQLDDDSSSDSEASRAPLFACAAPRSTGELVPPSTRQPGNVAVCVVFVCPPRSTHQPGEVVARVQTRG